MSNINKKNLISLGLSFLITFAFIFILIPKNVNAQNCNFMNFNGWRVSECGYNYPNIYIPPSVSSTTSTTNNSNVSSTKNSNTTVNKTTTNTKTTNDTTTENTNKSENENQVGSLAAGAIFGYNAFLPSSIFQWIFFFILILLAVVLWRKLYVSDEEKHTPLKHA